MRPGRLRLTLYLGAFVIAFVSGGLVLGFIAIRPPRPDLPPSVRHVVAHLGYLREARPTLDAELERLSREGIDVTLIDSSGHVIGSNVTPSLEPGGENTRSSEVDVGERVVGVLRFRPPFRPAAALVPIAILLVALVLLAVALARHLGGPLQKIKDAARRFGKGDLTARACLRRADELGEVGRAFDEMAERVANLMTAQRELMANVSHELHTPLARMRVAVDLIVDGIDPRAADLLPQISHELAELQRLIDDIMSLSRFDLARAHKDGARAPLRLELTSLAAILGDAVERCHARHPARWVELAIGELPLVSIDPVLIRRVVENLVDNAAKYSDASGTIRIAAVRSSAGISVHVVDEGIGIDDADLQAVFSPFFRTDRSRSRATGGFGLGLAFARRVVEAHGGTISIVSKPDDGTTVSFDLPA
jgi:two-component system OmpR family sensor kinase